MGGRSERQDDQNRKGSSVTPIHDSSVLFPEKTDDDKHREIVVRL